MRKARPQPRYLSGEVTRIFGRPVSVAKPVRERQFHDPEMCRGKTVTVFSMKDFTRGLFLRVARFKNSPN
jgi:hypothetical protein